MNGFPRLSLGGLPALLFRVVGGTSVRPQQLIIGANLSLSDNADGTATLTASGGGGGGSVATDAIWTAKGDLAVGTGAFTAAALTVGTDGQVLTADSTQTTGARWSTPNAGTVTSVAVTVPADLSVSGSPVTTAGTIAITAATQSANTVKAGPTTGAAATPAYRALVAADIPAIAESGVTNLSTDLGLKAPLASPTFTGTVTAPEFTASGLSGSVAASRYVGATASGAPTTGAHLVGDFSIDQTGKIWVCTVAGTPGTFGQVGAGGTASVTVQELDAAPSVAATVINFPNGSLTDNGSGSVTYTPTAGTPPALNVTLARSFI